jgi:hypothetical protein
MKTNIFFIILKLLISVGFFMLMSSCGKKTANYSAQSIAIDFDNIENIDLSDSANVKRIPLETTDNSLLYEIQSIEFLDNKIFVFTKNGVVAFDPNGKFLFNLGKRGQGHGEYQDVTSFFIQERKICLFDIATQRVLTYDENGQFLSAVRIAQEEEISIIYPLKSQEYIAINRYMSSNKHTSKFSFLNNKFEKLHNIDNCYLESTEFDVNCFYSFKNEILYWKFLNDTIYSITQRDRTITPKYIVDFQDYAIPQYIRETNNTGRLIEYVSTSDNPNIASLIRYVQEDSLYIRFGFIQKEAIINYSRFNKSTKTIKTCHIIDSKRQLFPNFFLLYKDGIIIISASYIDDEENNPLLMFVNENGYFDN